MTIKKIITLFILSISVSLYGNSIFNQPTPDRFVNDYARLLSTNEVKKLEKRIIEYDNLSSTQIAIVTVESLEGKDPAFFAHALAEKWGVGEKNKDNGVLILIKPKYKHEKGEVYIAVGYGLEHVIPDATAKRIVENILIPNFKRGLFFKGLDKSIDSIIQHSRGEYSNEEKTHLDVNNHTLLIIIGFSLILLPIFYLIYLRNRKIPDKYSHFYIKGSYNSKNVLAQVELMEKEFNQNYSKLKRLIPKYERSSRNNLIKYSSKIDQYIFCYLLNGRKRRNLFWKMADPFLLFIGIYLIIILAYGCIFLLENSGLKAFFVGIGISFIAIYALFGFLISFLEIFQFMLRKNVKYVGGVSVGLFALNSIFKRKIKRKYNSATNTYTYYPHIVYYSAGSSGSGFSGGYSGGFSGGGFGGGSFGGGGAGGSW